MVDYGSGEWYKKDQSNLIGGLRSTKQRTLGIVNVVPPLVVPVLMTKLKQGYQSRSPDPTLGSLVS